MKQEKRPIDCRGKACPQSVITAKEALDRVKGGELTLIVDDPSSSENVKRFALSQGCSVTIDPRGKDYYIHIRKPEEGREGESLWEKADRVAVYVNSDVLGVGEEALGQALMRAFLKTLLKAEPKPFRLILINTGVRLASEGSGALETLRRLSEEGVEILACGTCLDFYGLNEDLEVGNVSNMYEITQTLFDADRIIRP